jgi:molybdopterin/thiamine biosynthesis adenylyltransferase
MNEMRYQNHMSLHEFDEETQNKISESSVTIFGLGGLGSVCSFYLSNAGVGRINLVDYDTVDETNLPRQIIYKPNQIGENKAMAAKQTLTEFNPETRITAFNEKLMDKDLKKLIKESSLVIDATDNLPSRLQINEACHLLNVSHIVGTAIRFEGQVMAFDHSNQKAGCLNCLYSLMDDNLEDCDGAGVLSTVAGTIGILMANTAIKAIIGAEKYESMLVLDLKHNIIQNLTIKKAMNCSICS